MEQNEPPYYLCTTLFTSVKAPIQEYGFCIPVSSLIFQSSLIQLFFVIINFSIALAMPERILLFWEIILIFLLRETCFQDYRQDNFGQNHFSYFQNKSFCYQSFCEISLFFLILKPFTRIRQKCTSPLKIINSFGDDP